MDGDLLRGYQEGQMDGGNPETRAADNAGSSRNGLVFPAPLLLLLIGLISFPKPTPPPSAGARNTFHRERSTSNSVFRADSVPTCLGVLTPPDRPSLFRCGIVGFSHKVFTGYVKYNHGFMNMN